MSRPQILIGTRASKLALAQAGAVRDAIAAAAGPGIEVRLETFSTAGDRIQDRTLVEIGGKALFTLEIEEALREGRIQCAVHSMKDMPAEDPDGLVIGAVPERADPRDAFVSRRWASLSELPAGARVGTASLRRQAQCLSRRPDLSVFALRGNVDTRLRKLDSGEADAILLAAAGLGRLGLAHEARALIDPIETPPAPAQGALAVQVRMQDAGADWLAALEHPASRLGITAERASLRVLEGSCRTAIGAYARLDADRLKLVVEALTPDGSARFRREGEIELAAHPLAAADALGVRIGRAVREAAGDAIEF
ncbi:MAG TPA: hydroxymethylbilane synthase [Caulobacteraceae bacterium]|jgi:hydroxymethylbilane synthase|nr:hydroxymethylbilane synthase [Caulobacteraceae bacterium]